MPQEDSASTPPLPDEIPASEPLPIDVATEENTSPAEASENLDATPAERKLIRPPRRQVPRVHGDLSGMHEVAGSKPGNRYVRVVRQQSDDFEQVAPGHLLATEEALEARGGVGRGFQRLKRLIIGPPLATASAAQERLTNAKALAVLSSDALSSVAYATEEILRVLLITAGVAAMAKVLPIGAAIVALLLIVGISYRQTIKAYPSGGGAYSVAKDNLGEIPALTAAGSLQVSYVLTVSVSIAAAVAAIISAVPSVQQHRILFGIALIVMVTLLNLRGVRESGTIFAIPTYMFIVGMFVMIGVGLFRNAADGFERTPPPVEAADLAGVGALSLMVMLRAFSSGGAALTGVEAISNGVPVFHPPEWANARKTLTVMILILATTFAAITFLSYQFGAYPMETESGNYQTVVSQIASNVFGGKNLGYYYIQAATTGILVLAANTAYADFPRLAQILARDGYLPRQFTFRGDRLAFTVGIVALGIVSAVVLIIFHGETERMIPLYAIGVFASFTLSQAGMVRRWWSRREPGWVFGFTVNLIGASATLLVAIIAGVTKFWEGAWIVLVLVPLLVLMMLHIHKHYEHARKELATETPLDPSEIFHTVVVPIADFNRVAMQTLAYARSISDNVTAVHITDDEESIEQMQEAWDRIGSDIPLVIIESPYRQLVGPLLRYIDEIDAQRPDDTVTVVLPEYVARRWWEHLLHNQTALRIKAALLFRPGTVVTSVPYHLDRPSLPNRKRRKTTKVDS